MALKIALKPDERILINGALIRAPSLPKACRCGSPPARTHTHIIIENNAVFIREKDFMTEEEGNQSPARRLYYLAMMSMLDSGNEDIHRENFINWLAEIVGALRHPVAIAAAAEAGQQVRDRQYYHALKGIRHLIDYEANALAGIVPPVEAVAA